MTASPKISRALVPSCSFTGSAPSRIVPPRSRTSFCSGSRSMTGYGVSGSNSVELAPSMPTTVRANSDTAICLLAVEPFGVDPLELDLRAVERAGVLERFDDRQVGVLELHVLADQADL